MWMMAKSPLMYGGQLPIENAETLNLVTNKLALQINSRSGGEMRVEHVICPAAGPCWDRLVVLVRWHSHEKC